jgi:glycosyltransferase involved in cell wall biosynthesis
MKILKLFDFFSPSGGGTVDLVAKLARTLAGRGHEVSLYTSDFALDRPYLANLPEIKISLFHCVSSFAQFYFQPGIIKAVRRHLRDYDIVHLHCMRSFQNIVVHYYARKYGVPYVLDTHGSLPRAVPGEAGCKQVFRWLYDTIFGNAILRDAAAAIAETQLGMNEYRQFGVPEERLALIPPPFDTAAFQDLPAPGAFRVNYGLENKKIVMFLGRIHHIKGLDILAEGFAALAGRQADARLVIVGNDDGYRAELERVINKLGIAARVIFTGFMSGRDKLEALVDADVVVQTSRYEQGAWAPFEAVLCGTPIVVSDNSGAGEDVRRIDGGYLAVFGDAGDLADKIGYVLENPAGAREKTLRAKAYIETNMTIEKGIEAYERLYRKVTGVKS